MYKNIVLGLSLIGSMSLTAATKQLTLEEKVEKRFDSLATEHASIINNTQDLVEQLQKLMEKIISSERKTALSKAVQESLERLLVNIITKIKEAQETYLVQMAVIYKKLTSDTMTKAEMKDASTLYAKHLSLFSDEIAFLIKLLLPLKDFDTMTEEEIQAALTV